ncbi:DUF2268 domain-containing protein [Bacillus salacetis]|uniref:DUF2268 domain-containing protein n=1 Tax=Bacillus salacetis TaxID=2315464 RepID=UPI001443DD01|nr:DUF2268 domain-containing putative Zn-dependent protease [Bacillus salacetis]
MFRKRFVLLASSLFLMIAGCSNVDKQAGEGDKLSLKQEDKVKTAQAAAGETKANNEITVGDQTFHVIMLNKEIWEYAKAVENDSAAVKKEVYREKVVTPLRKQVAEADAHIYHDYFSFLSPNTNITKLKENAKVLLDDEERILELVEQGIKDSAQKMAGEDKTIIILPVNPDERFVIEKMGGLSGVAVSEDTVVLNLDPSFEEEGLKYLVAHEYHHTLQTENRADKAPSILEYFLLEGKADAFANSIYPDYKVPWTEPLSERLQEKVFDELRENGNDWDTNRYYEFFNGYSSKGIPMWSNYKVGFQVVQSYVRNNPDSSVAEWTALLPKEIILGSDYKDVYEELEAAEE